MLQEKGINKIKSNREYLGTFINDVEVTLRFDITKKKCLSWWNKGDIACDYPSILPQMIFVWKLKNLQLDNNEIELKN